ncbi:hypothetical protein UFOVP315_50, partial [uncultured Caudovirales phage]
MPDIYTNTNVSTGDKTTALAQFGADLKGGFATYEKTA